eukprot:m.250673 g.250673  ORF g.250673 m.250673 type:complete len:243 (+) comp16839_c0_seq1:184-912(+)
MPFVSALIALLAIFACARASTCVVANCGLVQCPSTCLRCNPPYLTYNGACITADACPSSHSPTSSDPTLPRACAPNLCHAPAPASSVCTSCRNGKYLLNGLCLNSCPTGYSGTFNSSQFFRRCEIKATPAAVCVAGKSNCQQCASSTACAMCKNTAYLLNGTCYSSCPSGYLGRGKGSFARFCVRAPVHTVCAVGVNHCTACANNRCTRCGNAQYLFDGECVATCPALLSPTGSKATGRTCV